jgi:hypothetical protein
MKAEEKILKLVDLAQKLLPAGHFHLDDDPWYCCPLCTHKDHDGDRPPQYNEGRTECDCGYADNYIIVEGY